MPVEFTYTPPRLDGGVLMHAVKEAAEHAMASAWLDASQPLVPVEDGILKASGRTVSEGVEGVAVTYGRDDDGQIIDGNRHAASNVYAVIQHEDMDLNHPHGGEAKFLEKPMHAAGEAILIAAAVELKAAFE